MWRTLQLWEDQTTHEEEKRTELKLLNAPLAVWRAVLIRCVSCFIKHRGVCLSVCASTFVRDAAQLMRTCCLWFLSGRKALGSGNSADCWSSDLGLALFPTFTLRALRRGNGSVPLSSQVLFIFFIYSVLRTLSCENDHSSIERVNKNCVAMLTHKGFNTLTIHEAVRRHYIRPQTNTLNCGLASLSRKLNIY